MEPGFDELDWGEPAVRAVRPVDVVVDAPVLEEDLGLEQRVEALSVQVLVTQAAVERFDPGVLPRAAGMRTSSPASRCGQPFVRLTSSCTGPSHSRSAPGPLSPSAGWATCWPSSSWPKARRCSTFQPPWLRGSGCWPPGGPEPRRHGGQIPEDRITEGHWRATGAGWANQGESLFASHQQRQRAEDRREVLSDWYTRSE